MKMIDDGKWHDFNRVVTRAAVLVPPNVALARAHQSPASPLVQREGRPARESRRRLHSQDQIIRSQRRDILWRALHDQWRRGVVETDPPMTRGMAYVPGRRIRLRDDHPSRRLLVMTSFIEDMQTAIRNTGASQLAKRTDLNYKTLRLFLEDPTRTRLSTFSHICRVLDMPHGEFHLVDRETGKCHTCDAPADAHQALMPDVT